MTDTFSVDPADFGDMSANTARCGQSAQLLGGGKEVHRSLPIPSDGIVGWLLEHGVGAGAMMEPWLLKEARVKFIGPDTFDFDDSGEPALIFRAEDREEATDLIAWSARTNKLATWRCATFCLGDLDQVFNPATYFMGGALRVHGTPLDWLRAERDGIVLVRPDLAFAYLRNCPHLVVGEAVFGRQLDKWIQPPRPTCKILVETQEERRAA